jgi:murein DD-endopeptidase MepM/ murein hydrolase activator NlpD
MYRIFTLGVKLVVILAFISGCKLPVTMSRNVSVTDLPATSPVPDASAESAATITPTSSETSLLVSPTPLMAGLPAAAVQSQITALPTPATDPLRFTFPTAASDPISLWRPPLYPVPWEPTPYDHFFFIRPIGANQVNWPLAKYRYGGLFYAEPHTGIDIPAPKGTPVLAAGPGVVVWAGFGLYTQRENPDDPYGNAVAIKHDFGYQGNSLYTVYGHMNQVFVYRGQHVEAGEQIGIVGETGHVSGPHLHFEVRIGNNDFFVSRNPELWLSPPQGWGVLVGRVGQERGRPAYKTKVKLVSKEGKGSYEVMTYAEGNVNSDPYYQENMVLGDLSAGEYMLYIELPNGSYKTTIHILPGQVTYFRLDSKDGIDFNPPSPPVATWIPPDPTATPARDVTIKSP